MYENVITQLKEDLNKGLGALFEAYGQKLYGYTVYQWNLSEDDSYDIIYKTLETICKVITRYEFSSEKHFVNWLFKIHKNNILQFLRAKKQKDASLKIINYNDWEKEVRDMGEEEFKVDQFKSVIDKLSNINPYEDAPQSNQLMLAMQKALLQLEEKEREILLLRMNNYTYEEIAKMLGIENNQLKVKFFRAKAKVEKKTLEILKDNYNETR
jgi:RNA polymerase sigma factor (sigma-70 family)